MPDSPLILIAAAADAAAALAALLGDKGDTLVVGDPAAALDCARRRRPELVLAGPGEAGLALCRALRGEPETAAGAVLLLAHDDGEQLAALQAGASDTVALPLLPAVLRARAGVYLALARQAAELARLADRDGLTGAASRRLFECRLAGELARHRRQGAPLGLALVDIDFFTKYNEAFGHAGGDDCLRRFAGALTAASRRPAELAARWGAARFAVLLPGSGRVEMERYGAWLAARVRMLALPHPGSPASSFVTFSGGLTARVPAQRDEASDLLAACERALHQARGEGGNRCAFAEVEGRAAPPLRLV